jgi:hypothetical protein
MDIPVKDVILMEGFAHKRVTGDRAKIGVIPLGSNSRDRTCLKSSPNVLGWSWQRVTLSIFIPSILRFRSVFNAAFKPFQGRDPGIYSTSIKPRDANSPDEHVRSPYAHEGLRNEQSVSMPSYQMVRCEHQT